MDPAVLPTRQADGSVTPFALPLLEHVQRRVQTDASVRDEAMRVPNAVGSTSWLPPRGARIQNGAD